MPLPARGGRLEGIASIGSAVAERALRGPREDAAWDEPRHARVTVVLVYVNQKVVVVSLPSCELRETREKGAGVFATRSFRRGDVVISGTIERELEANGVHACQVDMGRYVVLSGLFSNVNHSCDPNCGIRVNGKGGHDLVAFRPIRTGEELTFDYAMQNYSVEHFPDECLCGSPRCRGRVTGWKDLPDKVKRLYAGFVAPYLLECDASKRATKLR